MAQSHETCAETQVVPACRTWDTGSVRPSEAFDYYREGVCAAFMPLRPELSRDARRTFRSELRSFQISDMVLNVVSASTHTVRRGRREIARSVSDCVYINTQLNGECHIEQRGKTVKLGVGDVGIFDGAETFDLRHHAYKPLKVASLMVPRTMLTDAVLDRLAVGPAVLSGHPAFGHLLSEAGRAFDTAPDQMSNDALVRLSSIVLSLVSMTASPSAARNGPATRRLSQVQRIKHVIRQHCTGQEFNLAECAKRVGLSAGYIQQLLALNGERFGALLLEERLASAARRLSDPGHGHLSVATISYETGFKDTSHFGRVFREKYAETPGEWRQKRTDAH